MGQCGMGGPAVSSFLHSTSQHHTMSRFSFSVLTLLLLNTLLDGSDGLCSYKGSQVCEGAVTKELKTILQVCEEGRLKYKKREKVGKDYPLAGRGCAWYGDVVCDKAVVQDLYRWWFEARCSNQKLSVVARSWLEVTQDPRYKDIYDPLLRQAGTGCRNEEQSTRQLALQPMSQYFRHNSV